MAVSLIKLQRTALRLRKAVVDWAGWSKQVYFEHRVAEYRKMWQSVATAEGAAFSELARDLWQIDLGDRRTRILNHELEFDNPVVLGLAGRKTTVHRLLAGAGLAVPEHATFTLATLGVARLFVDAHPQGSVIKPAGGYGGKGVTTHVQKTSEVRAAALLASLYDTEFLIEAQIPGESYRLLVLEGRVIDAVCRRGPRILGNGTASVGELLAAENARRRAASEAAIDVDRDCTFTLGYQGLTMTSVPEANRSVLLKSVNDTARKYVEVRTVYTAPAMDSLCQSIRRDAESRRDSWARIFSA